MDKEDVVWSGIYIMKFYSVDKKNEILLFAATWMDLEEESYCMISLICGI